jgi:hypothetical protein
MKITGRPDLKDYGPEANIRQPPGTSKHWQDSVVLAWWDETNSISSFHRLGHQPNYEGGSMISLWNNLMSPHGMYKNTTFKPLRAADLRPNGGFGCGDDTCTFDFVAGEHVWRIHDGEVSAELRFTDISGNVDCFPKKGSLAEDFAAAHFDIPGTVRGWVEMGGSRWDIAGALGIRDHGWGVRDWDTILSHRWVVGTCGPALSFVVLAWHSSDDALVSFGWVIRGDEITFAKKIDLVTYVEIDAATNRGGRMSLTLEGEEEEVLEIECTPVHKAAVSYHHGVCCIDRMCTFVCGELKGVADFEATANLQRGGRTPRNFKDAVRENGFHVYEEEGGEEKVNGVK